MLLNPGFQSNIKNSRINNEVKNVTHYKQEQKMARGHPPMICVYIKQTMSENG
jgi:hypothetical protein